jgi:Ca2+-binding RTX toxin-like protein
MAITYVSNILAGIDRTTSISLSNTDEAIIARDAEVHTGGTAITAAGLTGLGERVSVSNHGSIMGQIDFRTGNSGRSDAYIDNNATGIIDGFNGLGIYTQGNMFLTLQNDGVITNTSTGFATMDLRGIGGRIVNNGDISGMRAGIHITTASDQTSEIINSGTIGGRVASGEGISGFGAGPLAVWNSGTIVGRVAFTAGNDFYEGAGGRATGQISGNAGNDTLRGGAFNDDLSGGDNNDILEGREGADRLTGGNGNDTLYFDAEDLRFGLVSGGNDYDTGFYVDDATPLTINVGEAGLEGYYGSAADEVVIAGNLGGFGLFADTGAGNDVIEGSTAGDGLRGGAGVDVLYGRAGFDELTGGTGGDWLQGGANADSFRYDSLLDSTINGQDYIADFSTAEGDKINLSNALAGLGPVTFNTGFGTGTSVYVFAGGGGTSLVQVYTGATLQMQIVASQAGLVASDFIL